MEISDDNSAEMDAQTSAIISRLKKEIRKAGGAKIAAEKAGVAPGTLTKNLSGDTKIALETVVKVAVALSLDMAELFGDDDQRKSASNMPIDKQADSSPASIDEPTLALRRRVMKDVRALYEASGLGLQGDDIAVSAMGLFQRLTDKVQDMTDEEEIKLALAQLMHNLKRELDKAVSEPGSGKRSA